MTERIKVPDDFADGLEFGIKSLSRGGVKRAVDGPDVIRVAMQHNLRVGNEDHRHRSRIDGHRTHLNTVLFGADSPGRVAQLAQLEVARLGAAWPSRINGVVAFEMVLQPPEGADVPEFWDECLSWVSQTFEHVLSGVAHRDQKRPHGHFIVLAIMGGRFDGRGLQRGDFGAPKLRRDFFAHIREKLGLRNDRPERLLKVRSPDSQSPRKSSKTGNVHTQAQKSNVQNCVFPEPGLPASNHTPEVEAILRRNRIKNSALMACLSINPGLHQAHAAV